MKQPFGWALPPSRCRPVAKLGSLRALNYIQDYGLAAPLAVSLVGPTQVSASVVFDSVLTRN